MSTGATGAVGPVSVRYAAQIRELLYTQAVQRMAADQEAARAEAERTARVEPADKTRDPQRDAKVETSDAAAPAKQPEAPAEKPATPAGHLVDIQA